MLWSKQEFMPTRTNRCHFALSTSTVSTSTLTTATRITSRLATAMFATSIYRWLHRAMLTALVLAPVSAAVAADCPRGPSTRYLDAATRSLLDGEFCDGHNFSDGLAAVSDGKLWGYVDHDTHYVIAPQYQAAGEFSRGSATVVQNNHQGLINKDNQVLIDFKYRLLYPVDTGTRKVLVAALGSDTTSQQHTGILSDKGEILVPLEYSRILYLVESHQFYAFFKTSENDSGDGNGIQIFNRQLEPIYRSNDYARLSKELGGGFPWMADENGNFPTRDGKPVLPKKPSIKALDTLISQFNKLVNKVGDKYGVSRADKTLIPPEFDGISTDAGLVKADSPDELAYLKTHFNAVATNDPAISQHYYVFFYRVSTGGKEGIYDLDGHNILPAEYEFIHAQENGFNADIKHNSKRAKGLMGLDGQWVLPPSSDYGSISLTVGGLITAGSAYDENVDYTKKTMAMFSEDGKLLTPFGRYFNIASIFGLDPDDMTYRYITTMAYQGDEILQGVIDRSGKEVIAPEWRYVYYWDDPDIIVLQKSYQPDIYVFYDVNTGRFSSEVDGDNWLGVIGEPVEGRLKIMLRQ